MIKEKILATLSQYQKGITSAELAVISKIKNTNSVRRVLMNLKKENLIENGDKRDCFVSGNFSRTYKLKGSV